MEQTILLINAFFSIFVHPDVFISIVTGIFAGIFLGALPGLSSTVGIVLIIPFSFYLSPLAAISMMYAVHKAGTYGGSITAILMNTPGTAASACTQLDGYPLTRQGKAGKALKVAVVASALGDLGSDLVLIYGTVHLANLVWDFGPVEMAAILFFALTLIATVTGKSKSKGIISALLGLLISMIGLDPMTAHPRFTFGFSHLENGLNLIPVLIGLFVISEVLLQAESGALGAGGHEKWEVPNKQVGKKASFTLREFWELKFTIFYSWLIGTIIGILPGLGAAVAPWISYGQVKSFSKNPEEFGKGSIHGIAASEASNNAVCGANLIPLLTLGVPGSTDAALMMSVFMINGIQFGPRIFVDYSDLIYGIFAAGLVAIIGYFLIGFFLAEKVGKLIYLIPKRAIYPVVLIITFIGAYAENTSFFDLGVMTACGVLGYFMRKRGFPVAPMIIAFMLGYKFESTLRQSLIISNNSFMVFLTQPVSLVVLILTVVILLAGIFRSKKTVSVGSDE
jgi:putative tricarboxylic transport membrane protein